MIEKRSVYIVTVLFFAIISGIFIFTRGFAEESASSYMKEGIRCALNEQHEQAIGNFKKALKIEKGNYSIYYNIGASYQELGQYNESATYFRKAIELNPRDDASYFGLGGIYDKLGDYSQAIQYYKKSLEINPDDAGAYYNMGTIYKTIGDQTEARDSYKRAKELFQQQRNRFMIQRCEENLNRLL